MATANATTNNNQAPAQPAPAAPEIDIKALAEKVYQLMLRDVRLAQVRGAQHRRTRR